MQIFVTRGLAERLGIDGPAQVTGLKTLNGASTSVEKQLTFDVSSIDSHENFTLVKVRKIQDIGLTKEPLNLLRFRRR